MANLETILGDLQAESAELQGIVAPLVAVEWARLTPAPGWTIAHQIAHLAWGDETAALAATQSSAFDEILRQAWSNPTGFVDECTESLASMRPVEPSSLPGRLSVP